MMITRAIVKIFMFDKYAINYEFVKFNRVFLHFFLRINQKIEQELLLHRKIKVIFNNL